MADRILKRCFDFIFSLSGLIISLPLWFIFTLLIWLEDGGAIFYFQERVGQNGKIFKSLKFRSMSLDAEKNVGPLQAQEDDGRVTKIGKIMRSIAMDELPQLVNIFKGDMSFVGPRALRQVEIDAGDSRPRDIRDIEGYNERSLIKPGLTGVAQIFAPRDIERSLKFKYDIWYINNHSFVLDIYLIILSFLITFMGKWEIREDKFHHLAKHLKKRIESQLK